MPDVVTLENGYKFCSFIYSNRRMLCNLFCRCGGDEISPKEIAYSQNTISSKINNINGDDVSVTRWENIEPYTIPLDVVYNESTELCSFDNRRLYAARNYAPFDYKLRVKVHKTNKTSH